MKSSPITHRILIAVGLMALFMAPAAFGQTRRALADIPFQFAAGGRVLPAGEYFIEVTAGSGRVELRGKENDERVLLTVFHGDRRVPVQNSALVFNRYGNARFLRQVALVGDNFSLQLSRSKAEREVARNAQPLEVFAGLRGIVR